MYGFGQQEHPHQFHEKGKHGENVTVWILFFSETVHLNPKMEMLQNDFIPELNGKSVACGYL
jgi:hypothetical protein